MKLVPETPLQITVAVGIAVIGATATISWVCANGLRDIKEELSGLRSDVSHIRYEAWTYQNQKDWVYALDKANKFSNIQVPDIGDIRSVKKTN